MKHDRLAQCLAENLSGMAVSAQAHRRMLLEITGGRRVRRKATAALAMALLAVLLAATAVAAALLNGVFEQAMDMELENGPISTWSLAEKTALIDLLKENGWRFSEADLAVLSDPQADASDRERAADSIITAAFGQEDAVSHMDIIESVKGPMATWSLEDKAWYSDFIHARLNPLDSWRDVLPQSDDLTAEEAVSIAQAALMDAYGLAADALADRLVNVSFFTTADHPQPRWMISWQTDPYAVTEYTVLLDRAGQVTADAALGVDTPARAAAAAAAEASPPPEGYPAGQEALWSLADKAAWLGMDNGLPRPDDVPEEQAVALAAAALAERGASVDGMTVSVWYKLYDYYAADDSPSAPFYAIYWTDDLDAPRAVYSVLVDAGTGEILQVLTPEAGGNG